MTLYRLATEEGGQSEDPVVEQALQRIGSGQALPNSVRQTMERKLGVALDRVRVHTDSVAMDAARAVRAKAFTVGEDIFFAEGAFAPDTESGAKLLAHELVHVIQGWQRRINHSGEGIRISQSDDPLEREADAIAGHVHGIGPASTPPRSDPGEPRRAPTVAAAGPEASAAARAVGARAFAIGDDVVFRDNAYDPHREQGRRLIAHEVAHTVQARCTSPASGAAGVSQPGDAVERQAGTFADGSVHGDHGGGEVVGGTRAPEARAPARPERLAGPSSSGATIYRQREPAGAQRSQGMIRHPGAAPEVIRRYDAFLDGVYAAAERIISTNIQAVEAWRHYVLSQMSTQEMGGQVFATGFEQVKEQATSNNAAHLLAPYAHEPNPIRQSLYEHQMGGEFLACTGCHVSNLAWEHDARMREAGDPGVTPAELLSGYAGTGYSSGRAGSLDQRIWTDPSAWKTTFAPPAMTPAAPSKAPAGPARGPEASLAAAQQAVAQIKPQLQQLGDGGYKIIPSNVISRFGQAPIKELQTAIETAFARRLSGYQQLMERIRAHSIDYLELDTLVSLMKPMATPEVKALIDEDMRRRQRAEVIIFAGMLLLDLLSIVVQPLIPVAGALHVAHGAQQIDIGTQRANATGLHPMMSREQQASGPLMQLAGTVEAIGGAVQVGLSVAGIASPRPGLRVVVSRTQNGITLDVLENGVVRGTHAAYPGKSVVMQRDGSFQAFDELGNVVGTGRVGPGGKQATATAMPPGGGQEAAATAMTPASRGASTQWPEVSPFYTGGAGAGTFPPNKYNPSGRGDSCGFTSMSYVREQQNPSGPMCTADDLYLQRLEQLGLKVDDNLSQMLVFPRQDFDGIRPRPGYEPLFDDNGGNRLSEYTVPSSAGAMGIPGKQANDALVRWKSAFGRHASIEEAVEARLELLQERSRQSVDPAAVRRWIEAERAELPGLYIVGSYRSQHYMTITIHPDGKITGFDPQNLAQYLTLKAVEARMGNEGFDLMYKAAMPPTGETR